MFGISPSISTSSTLFFTSEEIDFCIDKTPVAASLTDNVRLLIDEFDRRLNVMLESVGLPKTIVPGKEPIFGRETGCNCVHVFGPSCVAQVEVGF